MPADLNRIEEYIKAHKEKKPQFVAVSDDQWKESLDGHYYMHLQSGSFNEFKETADLWCVIYFSAIAFCRGMERQMVIDGQMEETLWPRY